VSTEAKGPGGLRKLFRAVRRLFVVDDAAAAPGGGERASRRAELSKTLPDEELGRVMRLDERRQYVLELASENRNLAGDLLQDELDKLGEMVDAFVDVACSCARWERHLKAVDWSELETDTRRHEHDAEKAIDPEHRALARRNLEVLLRRREQLEDLQRKVARARAQLDLIESTFKMLGNQVLLMSHPRELGAQLDELRVGIEAVSEMTRGDSDGSDPSAVG
jgi:hypothetical protein